MQSRETKKIKLFLMIENRRNYNLGKDLYSKQESLRAIIDLTEKIEEADVIEAENWQCLLSLGAELLKSKIVIVNLIEDFQLMLGQPDYLRIAPYVDYWLVRSNKAKFFAEKLRLNHFYVPAAVKQQSFSSLTDADKHRQIKRNYGLPVDRYLIANFEIGSLALDLTSAGYLNGVDVFLEIVRGVFRENNKIQVIIDGSQGGWLLEQLKSSNIPVTDIDQRAQGNISLKDKIKSELYNIVDLYLVTNRFDNGTTAILEGAATKMKIMSTDVGMAREILELGQIFKSFLEAKDQIINDIKSQTLNKYRHINHQKIGLFNLPSHVAALRNLYLKILRQPQKVKNDFKVLKRIDVKFWDKIISKQRRVSIYYQFHAGPWGGGNQFLKALSCSLKQAGWLINNKLSRSAKVLLFNSFHFNFEKMKAQDFRQTLVIHRIDGPTILVRGQDKELDDDVFRINEKLADISVFQSSWSLIESLNLGFRPINPVLISNASDPQVFNRRLKEQLNFKRKIRLVSTSWSNNPAKGGSIYKWLDENLDWSKYEYTFVGRVSEQFSHIKLIEPRPTAELAEIIKQQDIFLTASDNDPCSNSVVEALTCGLPVIYFNRGGHPELVGFGGLGFDEKEQIPGLLDLIVENYDGFKRLVVPNQMEEISKKYINVFSLYDSKDSE